MGQVFKAPTPLPPPDIRPRIFLAGSIEMGLAEDWQTRVERELADADLVIFNPRRDDWDSTWIQSKDNPRFREQVEWELAAMEQADLIPIYFGREYKAPISLLELGLFHRKMVVCCPEGFWRKGNVDVVCERYRVRQVDSLEELITEVRCRAGLAPIPVPLD